MSNLRSIPCLSSFHISFTEHVNRALLGMGRKGLTSDPPKFKDLADENCKFDENGGKFSKK